jgi:hypothetical protein
MRGAACGIDQQPGGAVKQILITGCSDPQMWYADRVGTTVPFVRQDSCGLWSREPAGYLNIVRPADGQIVELEAGRDSRS